MQYPLNLLKSPLMQDVNGLFANSSLSVHAEIFVITLVYIEIELKLKEKLY